MDCIKIRQLEIFAYHGCNEDEKINGQKFYVDANLYTDVRTPGLSDDLEDTVNYAKACKFINKFMTENRFDLIEAVAEQTTRGLLKEFPKIKAIDFTINKPNAPIKLPFGNVAVSISRKWNKAYLRRKPLLLPQKLGVIGNNIRWSVRYGRSYTVSQSISLIITGRRSVSFAIGKSWLALF